MTVQKALLVWPPIERGSVLCPLLRGLLLSCPRLSPSRLSLRPRSRSRDLFDRVTWGSGSRSFLAHGNVCSTSTSRNPGIRNENNTRLCFCRTGLFKAAWPRALHHHQAILWRQTDETELIQLQRLVVLEHRLLCDELLHFDIDSQPLAGTAYKVHE